MKDLEKQQASPPIGKQLEESYIFGHKEISFRVKAHDPRLFDAFKKNWEDDYQSRTEWHYDEAEREEEVFLHRIGTSPRLRNIMKMIPHVAEGKIPLSSDDIETIGRDLYAKRDVTDAILIENSKDVQLISLLGSLDGSSNRWSDITATFDTNSRKGAIRVRLMLPKSAFLGQNNNHIRNSLINLPAILGKNCYA